MWTITQTSNIIEVSKAVGIIIASVAAAIVLFIKAWSAIKNRSSQDEDYKNDIAAIYRILKEMKEFLEKEDPNADRPRIYTPRNMEKNFSDIDDNLKNMDIDLKEIKSTLKERLPRGDPTNA
ncbi:MAG: hypothetical protein KAS32_19660 [Candidatus Peribacteraceae bacterium]|nr:hypothetical protein [Candidatus Peribacteraceae bacterium]